MFILSGVRFNTAAWFSEFVGRQSARRKVAGSNPSTQAFLKVTEEEGAAFATPSVSAASVRW